MESESKERGLPQGLGSPAGWPNTGGQDLAFTRQLVAQINETFCVDTSRIFATGFSYGGMFTNTLGCQMGDVFRAIAHYTGKFFDHIQCIE